MDIVLKIQSILKKKKESIVYDLYVKDYEKSNFYIALVFHKKIEKFKVLFVPLDAVMDINHLEDYFCYQFVFISTVNYLLELIHEAEKDYKESCYQKIIPTLNSYYLEMHTYVGGESHTYQFSRYIDKEFSFLFESIVVLFEHCPNIMNELCQKILLEFQSLSDAIPFQYSFDFDLMKDSYRKIFSEESLRPIEVSYLERVGNRYYAFLSSKIVILEYLSSKKLLNIYCPFSSLGEEIYSVIQRIREEKFSDFYHLRRVQDTHSSLDDYYFCCGVGEDGLLVLDRCDIFTISYRDIMEKKVQIMNGDTFLFEEIRKYLLKKYEDFKVEEVLNFLDGSKN